MVRQQILRSRWPYLSRRLTPFPSEGADRGEDLEIGLSAPTRRCFSLLHCEMLVCPRAEMLDVRFIGVAAVVLSPGEFAIEHDQRSRQASFRSCNHHFVRDREHRAI